VPNFIFNKRFVEGILPLVICLLAAGVAYRLYRESPSLAGVHGVAEAREYTISSLEAGRLATVEVVPGQRVSRGQILASLDKGIIEQQIRVAEAELRELEAQVPAPGNRA
jgi:multidrug resistance efflux pump